MKTRRILIAVAIAAGSIANAAPASRLYLYCNHSVHGVVRGGPWARVGGAYNTIRECDDAKRVHRESAHPGDQSYYTLQCSWRSD